MGTDHRHRNGIEAKRCNRINGERESEQGEKCVGGHSCPPGEEL